ncbi:DUF6152 family protein [Roseibium salinum]|uniref:DUF6152 family protein n=1 Tax=Roseibium salinum TaxID=1604349 RepID=A0ABT3QYN1_9HYPH|nr:DUF6152 family protein [Roseibium sp. DSM 29163]MCX2722032.1 DUF6152 family protein [Roseibium sp. DSM 29163]MDN3719951.1 DUF6152 family protein [Roseibium salinum]
MRFGLAKICLAVAVLSLSAAAGFAHHGWRWTTGDNIELTGVITEAKLGNPHGVVKVDAEGEIWTVEVGQPWRNERAGLKDGDLAPGTEATFIGEPSADIAERLMKAENIIIGGQEYPLYPDRD